MEGLANPIFEPDQEARYLPETVPAEIVEKYQSQPEILRDIIDRYIAAAQYVRLFNRQFPVLGYVVVGSSEMGENLRPGKFSRKPASWVDMKTNLSSDIDLVICIDGDEQSGQRQAHMLARTLMMKLGYFPHVNIYDEEGLRKVAENLTSEWFNGSRRLMKKLEEKPELSDT